MRQAVLLAAKSLQQAPPVEQQHQRRHHTASQVAVNGVIALLVRASNSGLILGDQFERGIAQVCLAQVIVFCGDTGDRLVCIRIYLKYVHVLNIFPEHGNSIFHFKSIL